MASATLARVGSSLPVVGLLWVWVQLFPVTVNFSENGAPTTGHRNGQRKQRAEKPELKIQPAAQGDCNALILPAAADDGLWLCGPCEPQLIEREEAAESNAHVDAELDFARRTRVQPTRIAGHAAACRCTTTHVDRKLVHLWR